MSEPSVAARPARTIPPDVANELLDRIEAQLERLKRARPRLEATIQKASNILVAHLAGRPRHQIVRCRITPSGKAWFLFRSLTGNGAVYSVDPMSWSCSCPAAHRYEPPCKHGVAAFVLWKIATPDRRHGAVTVRDPDGCFACSNGIVRKVQTYRNERTGVVTSRRLSLPCKNCGGAG